MKTPLVELKNISMRFKRGLFKKTAVQAVSDISLSIQEHEILSVVGESGCGKTTLGKIVAALLKPSSGEVLWGGVNVWNISKKKFSRLRPLVQIVHQDPYSSLNPVKTVYQILSKPITHYKLAKNPDEVEKKATEILAFVGVIPPGYFLNKYSHHLSGGMRQRLSFARATIPKPKLVVADEPVSMIDASLRLSILNIMKKLNEELGMAFIYITHDMSTVGYLVGKGRTVLMYLGRIVELGGTQKLMKDPLHPYLRAIITSTPIPDPKIARKLKPFPLKNLEPQSASVFPPGCVFHPRCPYAEEICANEIPRLKRYRGHYVACHLIKKIPKWIPPWGAV